MFLQHFGYPLDNFIGIDANFLCTGHNYTTKCKKKLLSICKFNMDGHWTLKLLKENKRAVRRSRKSRWNPASCLFRQPSLPEEEFPVSPPAQWTSVVSQFRRKPRILNWKNCSRDTNRRGKRWPGSTKKSWVPSTQATNNGLIRRNSRQLKILRRYNGKILPRLSGLRRPGRRPASPRRSRTPHAVSCLHWLSFTAGVNIK